MGDYFVERCGDVEWAVLDDQEYRCVVLSSPDAEQRCKRAAAALNGEVEEWPLRAKRCAAELGEISNALDKAGVPETDNDRPLSTVERVGSLVAVMEAATKAVQRQREAVHAKLDELGAPPGDDAVIRMQALCCHDELASVVAERDALLATEGELRQVLFDAGYDDGTALERVMCVVDDLDPEARMPAGWRRDDIRAELTKRLSALTSAAEAMLPQTKQLESLSIDTKQVRFELAGQIAATRAALEVVGE